MIQTLRQAASQKRASGKTATARKLDFCIAKVEQFLADSRISEAPAPDAITPAFIESLTLWLTTRGHLTPNSAATYLRLIYSALRALPGADRAHLSSLFPAAGRANTAPADTIRLTLAQLRALAAYLPAPPAPLLDGARDLWLLATLSGGLDPAILLKLPADRITPAGITISEPAEGEGTATRNVIVTDTAAALILRRAWQGITPDTLPALLDILGSRQHPRPLRLADPAASRATYLSLATLLGHSDRPDTPEAIAAIAAAVDPGRRHWYAIRCIAVTPADLAEQLTLLHPAGTLDTFIPENTIYQSTPTGPKAITRPLLRDTLFFRSSSAVAATIRRTIHPDAYIYTVPDADGTRRPAIIPAAHMKMFMYINAIAPSRILALFPDEAHYPRFDTLTPVTITEGIWAGATGHIVGPDPTDPTALRVALTLPGLAIAVEAPIPIPLLTPQSGQKS